MLFTFENLRDKVWRNDIRRGDDAVGAAIKDVVFPVALHAMPWAEATLSLGQTQTLRNYSGVLMGFELDENANERVTVEVGVGDNPSDRLTVTPRSFVPAFKGVHCLPMLALAYDEIRLSCSDPTNLWVVQAVLSREGKADLAKGQPGLLLQFDDGYHVIESGKCQKWVPGQRSPDATPYLHAVPRLDA